MELDTNGHIWRLVCICNLKKKGLNEAMLEVPSRQLKAWVIAPLSRGTRHNMNDKEETWRILEKSRKETFENVDLNVT